MLEDRVKHRARTLHEPLNMLVDLAVDVRKEEKLLVSLDHEPGEMHGTEVVLRFCETGINGGSSSGSALAIAGPLIGKSTTRWLWLIAISFGCQNGHWYSGRRMISRCGYALGAEIDGTCRTPANRDCPERSALRMNVTPWFPRLVQRHGRWVR